MRCLVFATALCVLGGGNAGAQNTAEALLKSALAAQARLEFKRSIRLLRRAIAGARSSHVRAQLQLHLGINFAVIGDRGAAAESFGRAVLANAALDINRHRHKPAIVALFDRVRKKTLGPIAIASRASSTRRALVDGDAIGKPPPQTPKGTSAQNAPPARKGPQPRFWTWIAAGTLALTATSALAVGASLLADRAEYQSVAANDPRLAGLEATASKKAVASNVLFGLSAAFAAATALLYFYERRWNSEAPALRLGVSASTTGARAALRLEF